jgi:nitroimidazol reductase NimA-like FMN-containing flavoprotein (pyridoxamine 5'-phosphate oxidase superfamily)
MPRDYTQQARTHVRRRDRAVADNAWIKSLLERVPTGVLAVSLDGQPFANSNLFVYDEAEHAIILHTAREGRLRAVAERNPRACFSVHEMGRLLPADEALEFSVEYGGVSIFGRLSIVKEEEKASRGLQLLLDRYFPHLKPGEDYRPVIPAELKRTSVYKLAIEEWVGKQKKVEEDFPGAFQYPWRRD